MPPLIRFSFSALASRLDVPPSSLREAVGYCSCPRCPPFTSGHPSVCVRFACLRMAAMLSNCSRFAPRVITRSNVLRAEVSTLPRVTSIYFLPSSWRYSPRVRLIRRMRAVVPLAREDFAGTLTGLSYRDDDYITCAYDPIIRS